MTGHNSILDVKPFQVFDVLPQDDFTKVFQNKHDVWGSYSSEKLLNFRYSEKQIGAFTKVCDKAAEILISKGFENPQAITMGYLNHFNRVGMRFHKHRIIDTIDPDNYNAPLPLQYFWVTIYYPHEFLDTDYAGHLTVKLNNENYQGTVQIFDLFGKKLMETPSDEINVNSFASGVYLLGLKDVQAPFIKFIKQ